MSSSIHKTLVQLSSMGLQYTYPPPIIEVASINIRCADSDCQVITSFLKRNAGVTLPFAPPQGS